MKTTSKPIKINIFNRLPIVIDSAPARGVNEDNL